MERQKPSKIWYDFEEVAVALSMEEDVLRHYIRMGAFPQGIRRGDSEVWDAADIDAMIWLEQNMHRFPGRVERLRESWDEANAKDEPPCD